MNMELTILERKSLLAPARLPCLVRLPVLRLASGCMHQCIDCYAQGSCGAQGVARVTVACDPVSRLRTGLVQRRSRPRAICLDFASDPFQPVPELLDRTYGVVQYLLGEGVGVVFQTKATIPERHMTLLLAHAPLVRAIIPLVTTDRRTIRVFEPHTATPRTRLRQMRELVAGGVATLARVDPVLPGVTDDPDTMHGLCAALAEAGIREIAAGVLVLRPAFTSTLRNRLGRPMLYRRLMQAFDEGRNERLPGFQSAVRVMPSARRRRIFQWLTTIAGQYGIHVHVCECKNPDLDGESCKLAGQWSEPETVERQLGLFQFDGGPALA
jgi:DNA repair photolyase